MADNTTLAATVNKGEMIGILSEKNLKFVEEKDGTVKAISGNIVIDVDGEKFRVSVYTSKLTNAGEQNRLWDNTMSLKDEYVAQADSVTTGKEPDRVNCAFQIQSRCYKDTKGRLKIDYQSLNMNSIKRETRDVPNCAEVDIEGVVDEVKPQMNGEERTGKLLVTLGAIGYSGNLMKIHTVVDEDIADDFEGSYDQFDESFFKVLIRNVQVGGAQRKRTIAFGHTDKNTTIASGYTRMEFNLYNGDPAYPPDLKMDMEAYKKARQQYDVELDNLRQGTDIAKAAENDFKTKKDKAEDELEKVF